MVKYASLRYGWSGKRFLGLLQVLACWVLQLNCCEKQAAILKISLSSIPFSNESEISELIDFDNRDNRWWDNHLSFWNYHLARNATFSPPLQSIQQIEWSWILAILRDIKLNLDECFVVDLNVTNACLAWEPCSHEWRRKTIRSWFMWMWLPSQGEIGDVTDKFGYIVANQITTLENTHA